MVATQLLATFVGAIALIDRHLREAGQLQHFELSVSLGLELFQFRAVRAASDLMSTAVQLWSLNVGDMNLDLLLRFGFIFSYVLMLSHHGRRMSVISAFAAALAGACSVTLVARFDMQVHPVYQRSRKTCSVFSGQLILYSFVISCLFGMRFTKASRFSHSMAWPSGSSGAYCLGSYSVFMERGSRYALCRACAQCLGVQSPRPESVRSFFAQKQGLSSLIFDVSLIAPGSSLFFAFWLANCCSICLTHSKWVIHPCSLWDTTDGPTVQQCLTTSFACLCFARKKAWVGMKLFKRRVLGAAGAAIGFFCGIFILPLAMEQLFPVEEFQVGNIQPTLDLDGPWTC